MVVDIYHDVVVDRGSRTLCTFFPFETYFLIAKMSLFFGGSELGLFGSNLGEVSVIAVEHRIADGGRRYGLEPAALRLAVWLVHKRLEKCLILLAGS